MKKLKPLIGDLQILGDVIRLGHYEKSEGSAELALKNVPKIWESLQTLHNRSNLL